MFFNCEAAAISLFFIWNWYLFWEGIKVNIKPSTSFNQQQHQTNTAIMNTYALIITSKRNFEGRLESSIPKPGYTEWHQYRHRLRHGNAWKRKWRKCMKMMEKRFCCMLFKSQSRSLLVSSTCCSAVSWSRRRKASRSARDFLSSCSICATCWAIWTSQVLSRSAVCFCRAANSSFSACSFWSAARRSEISLSIVSFMSVLSVAWDSWACSASSSVSNLSSSFSESKPSSQTASCTVGAMEVRLGFVSDGTSIEGTDRSNGGASDTTGISDTTGVSDITSETTGGSDTTGASSISGTTSSTSSTCSTCFTSFSTNSSVCRSGNLARDLNDGVQQISLGSGDSENICWSKSAKRGAGITLLGFHGGSSSAEGASPPLSMSKPPQPEERIRSKDDSWGRNKDSEDGNFAAATCDKGMSVADGVFLENSLKDAEATAAKSAVAETLGHEGACIWDTFCDSWVWSPGTVWSKRPSPGKLISGLLKVWVISFDTSTRSTGDFRRETWPTWPTVLADRIGGDWCSRFWFRPSWVKSGLTAVIPGVIRAEAGGVDCPWPPWPRAVSGGDASPGRHQGPAGTCGGGLCHTACVTYGPRVWNMAWNFSQTLGHKSKVGSSITTNAWAWARVPNV